MVTGMDPALGGVSEAVRNIIIGLTNENIFNEVVSLDPADAEFIKDDAFTLHAIGAAKGPWRYNSNLTSWLYKNLLRFDVVIVHGLWVYHGFAVIKTLKQIRNQLALKSGSYAMPKLYIMPHGMLDPYFQRATGRRLKAIRNIAYWSLIEKNVVNSADGVLFTCQTELILAREPFKPYLPKSEMVVGLGVNEPPLYTVSMREAFYGKCTGLNGKPYFLFLGRIHEKKGVDLLLKAYARLVKNTPANETVPHLVIAGPGFDSLYGKQMITLAFDVLQLNGLVHFPGMLTGAAKWGAIYGCESFLLPSHQENFGIAVVEAMACSKAVLISKQVNIWREIYTLGGAIVDEDTEEGTYALFDTWTKLSEAEKESKSNNALKAYTTYFSVDTIKSRFNKVLNRY